MIKTPLDYKTKSHTSYILSGFLLAVIHCIMVVDRDQRSVSRRIFVLFNLSLIFCLKLQVNVRQLWINKMKLIILER